MNKDKLLREILKSDSLKEYWKDADPEIFNSRNLLSSDNNYIKALHYVLNANEGGSSKKLKIEGIFKLFNL